MKKTVATLGCMIIIAFLVFPSLVCAEESWDIQTIDNYSKNTRSGLIAIDSKGNPHIVYTIRDLKKYSLEEAISEVKYARWNGTDWNITTVFEYTANLDFVLDSNDNPHILLGYWRGTLTYATWTTGKGWVSQTIDSNDGGVSLALDSEGNPHIAYFVGSQLKYASYNGTNWDIRIVNPPESLEGPLTTTIILEFDSNDTAHIMYTTGDSQSINHVVGNGDDWNVSTFFEGYELEDMALDSKDNPHIVYVGIAHPENHLSFYARWKGTNWDSQNISALSSEFIGYPNLSKLALDSHDRPHIVTSIDRIKLMYTTLRGNDWEFQTIAPGGVYGINSIAVDSKDNPHVCYHAEPGSYRVGYYVNYSTANITEYPPPEPLNISVVSPENKTYTTDEVQLTFTLNKQSSSIYYSIDDKANTSITENTTITNLTNGTHKITIYTEDNDQNTTVSETVYFTTSKQDSEPSLPFPDLPITLIIIALVAAAIGAVIAILLRLEKRNKNQIITK